MVLPRAFSGLIVKLHERKTAEYNLKVEYAKRARAEQWKNIQEHAPNLAKTLLDLKAHFGKVELKTLQINHEQVKKQRTR